VDGMPIATEEVVGNPILPSGPPPFCWRSAWLGNKKTLKNCSIVQNGGGPLENQMEDRIKPLVVRKLCTIATQLTLG